MTHQQQFAAIDYQAFAPPYQLPEMPAGPPNFISAEPAQAFPSAHAWFDAVYRAWVSADPPPTIPAPDALNLGLGPSFTVRPPPRWLQNVLTAWAPPDPTPTLPAQYGKTYTPGGLPVPPPVPGGLVTPPHGVLPNGAVPVYVVVNSPTGGVVPRAGLANAVAQGGSPVAFVVGPINGGYLYNPPNAAAQGIATAEDINVDMTTPPQAGDAYGYGTTTTLIAGQTFTLPALAPGVQGWANAVTSGHRFTLVVW